MRNEVSFFQFRNQHHQNSNNKNLYPPRPDHSLPNNHNVQKWGNVIVNSKKSIPNPLQLRRQVEWEVEVESQEEALIQSVVSGCLENKKRNPFIFSLFSFHFLLLLNLFLDSYLKPFFFKLNNKYPFKDFTF
jgi:hypothetical protein